MPWPSGPTRECPRCGAPMRYACGSTATGREWTRWQCTRCCHEETCRGVGDGAIPRQPENHFEEED